MGDADSLSQSPADKAFDAMRRLVADQKLFSHDSARLSEADTRAKLIDPLFREVLGWSEAEIRREAPAADGYADYTFGIELRYLLVEAKRTRPRFHLEVTSHHRLLKLKGPHLLGQKKLHPHLKQTRAYASDLGAQVAILTNGDQFIAFKPYLVGRSWVEGSAIVFHSHADILQAFAAFYRLFSRDGVVAGTLLAEFEQLAGKSEELFAPIQYLRDADEELVRNPFWARISAVMGPLLTDQAEDQALQQEIISNCYVPTKISDEAVKSLDRLLRDVPGRLLTDAQVIDTGAGSGSAFAHYVKRDIQQHRPGTYLLTGGVGSGKTTFLRHFALVTEPQFLREYAVWVHVDFLTIGAPDSGHLGEEISRFLYRELRRQLELNYPERIPQTGEEIRELFAAQIEVARKTRLYMVSEASAEWNLKIGELVEELFRSDKEFVTALLGRLRSKSLRLAIVLEGNGVRLEYRVSARCHFVTATLRVGSSKGQFGVNRVLPGSILGSTVLFLYF